MRYTYCTVCEDRKYDYKSRMNGCFEVNIYRSVRDERLYV